MLFSKKTRVMLTISAALYLAVMSLPCLGQTVAVGTCLKSLPSFSTIQDAVNTVPSLGTVKVCPGNYPEQVIISKPLTLTGISSGTSDMPAVIAPAGGIGFNFGAFRAQIVVNGATGVNINNISVDGANNLIAACSGAFVGILYSDSSGTVNKVAFRNQNVSFPCELGQGLRVRTSSTSLNSNVTVTNSVFREWQYEAIHAVGGGVNVVVQNNYIAGMDNNHSAGNAIDFGFGATGSITGNNITDGVFIDDVYPDFFDATWGILLQCVQGVMVSGNTVASTQGGIVLGSWFCSSVTNVPRANLNTVASNKVYNTKLYDAIYVCGDSNVIQNNTLQGAGESGIKLDNSCDGTTANNNSVLGNKIDESCAALLFNGGFPSALSGNTFSNVFITQAFGATCGPLFGDPEPSPTSAPKNLQPGADGEL